MKTKLLFFFALFTFTLSAQVSQEERQALIDFYIATDGDNWTNNTNWDTDINSTSDVSTWYGVSVASIAGQKYVNSLTLSDNNLVGELPNLSKLVELKSLNFINNNLRGTINVDFLPPRASSILFDDNQFSGNIPDFSNKSRIVYLRLGNNHFTGSVKSSLFNKNINSVWLNNNDISGELDFSDFDGFNAININNTNINFLKLPHSLDGDDDGSFRVKNTPKLAYVEVGSNHFNDLRYSNFDVGLRIVSYDEADKTVIPNAGDREAILRFDNNIKTFKDAKSFGLENINEEVRITQISLSNYTFANNTLPTEVGLLTELKSLNLFQCKLNSIPNEFGNLVKVESVYLNNNSITSLPSEIGNLTNLKDFRVNNNSITILPENFYNLSNLEIFEINNNPLLTFSSGLGNLSNLLTLKFNNTQVDLIPNTIGNLKKLVILEFSKTKISLLPPQIGGLTALTRLVAAPNNIASIPAEFGQLTKLTYLDFANCELSNTPAAFANLTQLETLFLNDNELQVVAGLGGFTKLKYLRLHNNRLGEDNPNFNTDLPEDMSDLILLEELTLYYNQLTKLPTNIGNLSKLTSLKVNNNKLASLPSTIENLQSLKELHVQANELTGLPITIGNLTNLEKLYLSQSSSNNQITSLPDEIGNLSNLKELYIENMRSYNSTTGVYSYTLTSLPSTMNQLTNLEVLRASNNVLEGLVDLTNLLQLKTLRLDNNRISDLKVDAPVSNFNYSSASSYFNVSNNPYLTCVEVPSDEITNWDTRYAAIPYIADNGIAFSDNCSGFRVPQSERDALVAFYLSTKGGDKVDTATGVTWVGTNWNTDATELTNVGSWQGVTTEIINGQKHVTKLELSSKRLSGSVPKEIKDLPELTLIQLSGNTLETIATEIGDLSKLTYLNLSSNSLESLPTGIGNFTSLQELYLQTQRKDVSSYSRYTSSLTSLPEEIGDIASLEKLDLSNNGLTSLPAGIGNFTSLKELKLDYQQTRPEGIIIQTLTSLPNEIGNITSLEKLYLNNNKLTSLPSTIGNLVKLEVLNISDNLITSDLDLGMLEVLSDLRIDYNNILSLKIAVSPTIFGTYAQSPGSNRFHAKRNALGCIEVPTDELVSWQLSFYNEEGGIIDNGVVYSDNCSAVTTNSIPDIERDALISIYNNTKGTDWKNDLSSSYNGVLWEADNTLKRNVGAWYGVTTEMINGQKHVTKVELNSNLLDGTLPSVIKNLTQLKELEFNNNAISEIPVEIGELANLEQLTFNSQRSLDNSEYVLKSFPTEINDIISLKRLELSSNQFEGNLDFSMLTNLTALSVSSNQITGLKIGVSPNVFDNANQDGYSNRFSFSSNQYLNCIAVPDATISDWEGSTHATNYPSIVWGQDCSAYNNVPENEIQALVDLYNSLDGANWTNSENWTGNLAKAVISNPYNATKWRGITTKIVDGGKHITDVSLSSNKLKGEIPESFGNLSKLTNLQLSSNEISGALPSSIGNLTSLETLYLNSNKIDNLPAEMNGMLKLKTIYLQNNEIMGKVPDFTEASTLERLYISSNKFQFGDFEDKFTIYQNLKTFSYTSQEKVGEKENVDFGDGFDKTLVAVVSGTNNTYQWYKNGGKITDAIDKQYEITDATQQDAGYYYCRVSNSIVTSLTIETERVTLNYDATLSVEDKEVFNSVIKLYPNPVENVLQISNTSDIRINKVEIYTILGKKIQDIKNPKSSLDISQLSKGIYLLNVFTEKGKITKKIIK